MKCIITILIFSQCSVFATRQLTDQLELNGKKHFLESCLSINEIFTKSNPRPKFDWHHTGNWKAYHAIWELRKEKGKEVIYLKKIIAEVNGKKFDSKTLGLPKKATWINDVIIIPIGEEIGFYKVNNVYRYYYEEEKHLTIKNGLLIKSEIKKFNKKEIIESNKKDEKKH